jgi:hypothetical protein
MVTAKRHISARAFQVQMGSMRGRLMS